MLRIFGIIALFSVGIFAATLEDAQKAYVSGNWKAAAEAFDSACPTLEISKRAECSLWGILALSQTGSAKDFSLARKRLDSLISAVPDSLPVVSDLYMTRAQFELYLKRPDLSFRTLKLAFEKALPRQIPVLHQVCQSIYAASPMDSVHALCAEMNRAKSSPQKDSATPGPTSSSAAEVSSAVSSSAEASSSNVQASSSSSEKVQPAIVSSASAQSLNQKSDPATAQALPQPAKSAETWTLQLGAFGIRANAERLVEELKAQKIESHVVESPRGDKTLYLVQTGTFSSQEEAIAFGESALKPITQEFQLTKKP